MRTRRTIFTTLLILSIGLLWSMQAGAYGLFTADPPESGNCSQCHTDWPGATHTVHMGFDCGLCHVDEMPVPVSSCSGCHPAAGLLEAHSPLEGPGDMFYCGYCHDGVGNESRSWGELKDLFE
jgi:hypothetical protein